MIFRYLKSGYKENRGSLFTRNHMEKTRGNRYKLHQARFRLDIRIIFFTVRKSNHWNNIPSDVMESPSLEVFKVQLDRVVDNRT